MSDWTLVCVCVCVYPEMTGDPIFFCILFGTGGC